MMKRDIRLVALAVGLCVFAACKDKPAGSSPVAEPVRDATVEKSNQGAAENIDANEQAEAKKLKAVKDPVSEQINAFRRDARLKYNDSNFDELEKLATE